MMILNKVKCPIYALNGVEVYNVQANTKNTSKLEEQPEQERDLQELQSSSWTGYKSCKPMGCSKAYMHGEQTAKDGACQS
jgi:hypothetical protein